MLVGWIADDFSNPIISYYTGIADSAAFMYSVSLCLLLLCIDFDKNIHKKTRSVCGAISGFSVIISTLFYGIKTVSNVEKNFKLMAIESETEKIAFFNDNMNNISNKFSLLTSMITVQINYIKPKTGVTYYYQYIKRDLFIN